MSVELNACPFCGGDADLRGVTVFAVPRLLSYRIVCGCGAGMLSDYVDYDAQDIIDKWNRRAEIIDDSFGRVSAAILCRHKPLKVREAEVLPCPFCGGVPAIIQAKKSGEKEGSPEEFFYWSHCEKCRAWKSNGVPCSLMSMIDNWCVRAAVQQCLVISD